MYRSHNLHHITYLSNAYNLPSLQKIMMQSSCKGIMKKLISGG